MRIGIEAERANNPQKTGVEHYAKQLILSLAEQDKKNQYILYLRTKPEGWFNGLPENFAVKVMPFPIFWTQIRVSLELFFNPVDALFIPASALPIYHPKNSVVTIHDLAWKFYPETFTWFNRNFLEFSTNFAIKKAKAIIAVSLSTKRDLMKFYKIAESKISVVHHGYEHQQVSQSTSQPINLDLPKKYILFLSTLQPRKNLEGLIDAFAELKKENPQITEKLLVVGKPGWKFEPILKKIEDHKDFVIYLNHVSDSDRFRILEKAKCLVLPSFYEGFGMQILEAFAVKLPVLTSNISSMPEVAGDAAIYFDPHNLSSIKNAIKTLLNDVPLVEKLKIKGLDRLRSFSWKECAEQTLNILNS